MDQLIAGLQESLDAEYWAAFTMFQAAHTVKGLVEYELYHDYLHDAWKAENQHMHLMANYLQGFQIPVKVPAVNVPVFDTVEQALEHQYSIRVWAIERYTRLTKLCESIHNLGMANFFQSITDEEEVGRLEVIKRLGRIPTIESE